MTEPARTTDEQEPQERLWRDVAVKVWAIIGLLVLLAVSGWVLGLIFRALVPFIIAFFFAYVLRDPVRRLETAGMPRWVAIVFCYLGLTVLVAFAAELVVPVLAEQVRGFVENIPRYSEDALGLYNDLLAEFSGLPRAVTELAATAASELASGVDAIARSVGAGIFGLGGTIVEFIVDVFLGLIIAFWVLKDAGGLRRDLLVLVGPKYREDALHLSRNIDHVMSGYLLGQTINTFTVGILLTALLTALHVPYALVLGVIAGVLNLVPYVGPAIGAALTVLVALFVSPVTALWALLGYLVVQQVQDGVVSPLIMSEGVNLHPILVIFSITVGGTLFGFPGLLFAIPVAAVTKGVFVYYFEKHSDREIASEDGTLFKVAAVDVPRRGVPGFLDRIRRGKRKG